MQGLCQNTIEPAHPCSNPVHTRAQTRSAARQRPDLRGTRAGLIGPWGRLTAGPCHIQSGDHGAVVRFGQMPAATSAADRPPVATLMIAAAVAIHVTSNLGSRLRRDSLAGPNSITWPTWGFVALHYCGSGPRPRKPRQAAVQSSVATVMIRGDSGFGLRVPRNSLAGKLPQGSCQPLDCACRRNSLGTARCYYLAHRGWCRALLISRAGFRARRSPARR